MLLHIKGLTRDDKKRRLSLPELELSLSDPLSLSGVQPTDNEQGVRQFILSENKVP